MKIDNKEPSQKPHNIFLQDMYSIADRIKTNSYVHNVSISILKSQKWITL